MSMQIILLTSNQGNNSSLELISKGRRLLFDLWRSGKVPGVIQSLVPGVWRGVLESGSGSRVRDVWGFDDRETLEVEESDEEDEEEYETEEIEVETDETNDEP